MKTALPRLIAASAFAALLAAPLSASARSHGDSRHPDPRGGCRPEYGSPHHRSPPPLREVHPVFRPPPFYYWGCPRPLPPPPPPPPPVVYWQNGYSYPPPPPPPPPPPVWYPVRPGVNVVLTY